MGDEVLCIGLLGVFSISAGDSVIADDAWRLRKAKTLIKLLALAPERRLHVDQAAELLWAGRDADSARNNLHQAIFAARRALDSIGLDGSRCLQLREELILLSPEDPVRIDAVAFEELAAAAREQGEPGAYRSRPSRASTPSCCRRTATRTGAGSGAIPSTSSASPWSRRWSPIPRPRCALPSPSGASG
jgi:hypothetical protein